MSFTSAAVAIVLALVCTRALGTADYCNFLDDHLERAIYSFIEKIPAEISHKVDRGSNPAEGFNFFDFKLLGLNSLRPFGPFLTFCRSGRRLVQFDLVNNRPLVLVGSSVGTDSNTYQIVSRALIVRFTAQFEVEGSVDRLKIYHRLNMPVSMVGLNVLLKAADKAVDLGTLNNSQKPDFLRTLWNGVLYTLLDKVIGEILPKK